MNFDIGPTTILLVAAGSHAHGMATPQSDVDIRGICVAPLDVRLSLFHKFEQYEAVNVPVTHMTESLLDLFPTAIKEKVITDDNIDIVVYDIAKILKLLVKGNPSALELLFSDGKDVLFHNDLGRQLREYRDHFVTLKVKDSCLGYARSQLARIKRDKANPKNEKNSPRRRELKDKFGYDTKHAAHLIRLMRMGLEVMQGRGVIVRRPDAQELLDIREGKRSLEDIIDEANRLDEWITELAEKNTELPKSVDNKFVDELAREMMLMSLR